MWISSGDRFVIKKYDKRWIVVRHNKDEHPREVRTNRYAVAMYIAIFLCVRLASGYPTFSFEEPYYAIAMVAIILTVPLFVILALLKWKKNNKELDIALLIGLLAMPCLAYMLCY